MARGGRAIKLVPMYEANLLDRLILLPGAHAGFVEVKALGEKLRLGQAREAARLRALGFPVVKLDAIEDIEAALREIETWT